MTLTVACIVTMLLMVGTISYSMTQVQQPGAKSHPPYIEDLALFKVSGLGKIFTTALFSQLCHQGVPSFVMMLRHKHHARGVFASALSTTFVLYCALGLICSLYFGKHIHSVITLNWRDYGTWAFENAHDAAWCKVVMYFIVGFPLITTMAAFPIYGIILVQNLSKSIPQTQMDRLGDRIETAMRILICLLPIAGAAGVKDVSKILEFNGLFGFFLAFFIPCLLHIRARSMCIERWGTVGASTPYSWAFSHPIYCKGVLGAAMIMFCLVFYEVIHDYVDG